LAGIDFRRGHLAILVRIHLRDIFFAPAARSSGETRPS
jgi:hypothetical protein